MKLKKIAGIIAVVGMISSVGAIGVSAAAEEMPVGYVTVSVEKFTLGQGFILEPVKVPYFEGETGADITDRALGKENVNMGNGTGSYISSIADDGFGTENIPQFIIDAVVSKGHEVDDLREDEEWLSGMDYYAMSGWNFTVENQIPSYGINDYVPENGDVLRWQYTIVGYGADIGYDTSYMAEWGGMSSLIPETDRTEIISVLSEAAAAGLTESKEYKNALQICSDLSVTQSELDRACSALNEIIKSKTIFEYNNFIFEKTDKGLILKEFKNASFETITIPKEVNGVSVVGVSDFAFGLCNVKSIDIPDTLQFDLIGKNAFMTSDMIRNFKMPLGVNTLNDFFEFIGATKENIDLIYSKIGNVDISSQSSLSGVVMQVLRLHNELNLPKLNQDKLDLISYNGLTLNGSENSIVKSYSETKNGMIYKISAGFAPGDATMDGKVDLYDAIAIAGYLLNPSSLTDEQIAIADFNNNGNTDIYDAIAIAKTLM